MGPTEINLYGKAHVKVDFILLQKMYVIPRVGRFVWTTSFAMCVVKLLLSIVVDQKMLTTVGKFYHAIKYLAVYFKKRTSI